MLQTLQVVTLLLVAFAMVPAVAHALELPGKLRLPKDTYLAVQAIYYPGFTIAGFSEIASLLATAGLLVFTPSETNAFWLTLGALVALVLMHAAFWVFTQPVNKFWLSGQQIEGFGAAFFGLGTHRESKAAADWTVLRNQWEYSHVARAVMSVVALAFLATAIALS